MRTSKSSVSTVHRGKRASCNARRALILIAACAGILLAPAMLHAQEWYDNYEQGLVAFRNGQWQAAVQSLTEAINDQSESKPNKRGSGLRFIDYFPYVYRGVAYFKLDDREKARIDLEHAESEKQVQSGEKDTDAARLLREYLPLVKKPAQPQTDARFTEGMKLYRKKDYKGAIEQFNSVPENSPQRTEAVKYRLLAESAQRDAESAATTKDKNDRISRALAAGGQYLRQNDLDNAEAQFKVVQGLDANNAEARRSLTRIASLRQKPAPPPSTAEKQPVREQPRIVSGPPADTTKQVLFRDAVALFTGGKIAQAKAKFLDVKGLDPAYPGVATYLQSIGDIEAKIRSGISAFFAGEYQKAITQLQESSRNGSDNAHMYAFLACSYAAQYLLTGAEDRSLRENAVDAFGKTKQADAGYTLNDRFISPKIIALLKGN